MWARRSSIGLLLYDSSEDLWQIIYASKCLLITDFKFSNPLSNETLVCRLFRTIHDEFHELLVIIYWWRSWKRVSYPCRMPSGTHYEDWRLCHGQLTERLCRIFSDKKNTVSIFKKINNPLYFLQILFINCVNFIFRFNALIQKVNLSHISSLDWKPGESRPFNKLLMFMYYRQHQ